jgi:hypothetical protein
MKSKRDSNGRRIDKRTIPVLRQQTAVDRGKSATSVAVTLGMNVQTVFRWFEISRRTSLSRDTIKTWLRKPEGAELRYRWQNTEPGAI